MTSQQECRYGTPDIGRKCVFAKDWYNGKKCTYCGKMKNNV